MSTDVKAVAAEILRGFDRHYASFRGYGARARQCFLQADWQGLQRCSSDRIDLYDVRVHEAVQTITQRFPAVETDESLWPAVKQAFIGLLYEHRQPELAETFYNSVACRILHRTYYRNDYIFWRPAVSTSFLHGERPAWRTWPAAGPTLRRVLRELYAALDPGLPLQDERRELARVLATIRENFPKHRDRHAGVAIQLFTGLFFRGRSAYAIGRIVDGPRERPFALCLRHAEEGRSLQIDALLFDPEHLGALFSLARSYLLVDVEVPSACVAFLRKALPSKRRAELYTALGLQKQGKTLFYRDLHEHLENSVDDFVVAPGIPGMVMMVFHLPSFPYVFKLIRDRFSPTKDVTPETIKERYRRVKHLDRVGRMADSLEYSDVAFPLSRIDPALLAELRRSCASSLVVDGDRLVIEHLYIERRMTPLDLWLKDADDERLRHGIDDFGRAIREMACNNVFPGDMFVKNFGVTRYGRVVFYDFDEIEWLTEMNFRRMPKPRDYDDEVAAEPWFSVGPKDVFPEELPKFLFPAGRQRELFLQLHPELADAAWWQARQEDVRAGRFEELLPYPDAVRFSRRFG